jgi:hypothetical protein
MGSVVVKEKRAQWASSFVDTAPASGRAKVLVLNYTYQNLNLNFNIVNTKKSTATCRAQDSDKCSRVA